MARLNLICNGMMFLNEVGDRLQVVIPDIPGHVRKFCQDPQPAKSNLVDVPIGDYRLNVPGSNTTRLADLLDSSGYVLLDGAKVTFNERRARQFSAVFTVPKPTIIRLYRASEPLPGFDILGNCRQSVRRVPSVAHDIVVLSYKDIPVGATVNIGPSSGKPFATATTAPLTAVNWILYSNETMPFPLDLDLTKAPDEAIAEALVPFRHPTPLNDFLEVNAVGGTSGPAATTLNLSGIGKKDSPCVPAIGISRLQLFLYHELPDKVGGPITEPVSGEPGCSGAARATQ